MENHQWRATPEICIMEISRTSSPGSWISVMCFIFHFEQNKITEYSSYCFHLLYKVIRHWQVKFRELQNDALHFQQSIPLNSTLSESRSQPLSVFSGLWSLFHRESIPSLLCKLTLSYRTCRWKRSSLDCWACCRWNTRALSCIVVT